MSLGVSPQTYSECFDANLEIAVSRSCPAVSMGIPSSVSAARNSFDPPAGISGVFMKPIWK